MRKIVVTAITLIVFIVSIFATNAFAASSAFGYGVNSRTQIGTIYNNGSTDATVYAKAIPTSGYTYFELINGGVPPESAYGIYPVNPVNPNYIHVMVYASGSAKVFASPYGCNYTSGSVDYHF